MLDNDHAHCGIELAKTTDETANLIKHARTNTTNIINVPRSYVVAQSPCAGVTAAKHNKRHTVIPQHALTTKHFSI